MYARLITALIVLACGLFGAASRLLWCATLSNHYHLGHGVSDVLLDLATRNWLLTLDDRRVWRGALDGAVGGAVLGCLVAMAVGRYIRVRGATSRHRS